MNRHWMKEGSWCWIMIVCQCFVLANMLCNQIASAGVNNLIIVKTISAFTKGSPASSSQARFHLRNKLEKKSMWDYWDHAVLSAATKKHNYSNWLFFWRIISRISDISGFPSPLFPNNWCKKKERELSMCLVFVCLVFACMDTWDASVLMSRGVLIVEMWKSRRISGGRNHKAEHSLWIQCLCISADWWWWKPLRARPVCLLFATRVNGKVTNPNLDTEEIHCLWSHWWRRLPGVCGCGAERPEARVSHAQPASSGTLRWNSQMTGRFSFERT